MKRITQKTRPTAMKRITRNDDINFNVDEIRGKGERYNITFYTTNNAVNISKTDQNVNNGIIVLNGSELMTLGEGVLNLRVDNIAPNAGYNDGIFNSSFTRTTDYYIKAGVIVPDGSETQTVIEIVGELQDAINAEVTRSSAKDNAHDTAIANVYTKSEINEMLDDIEIDLPDNIVSDSNYVHTDNNFTTAEKNKLENLARVATTGSYADLTQTPTIPTTLAELESDNDHMTVTLDDALYWDGKQDAISDLATIRSGAAQGANAMSLAQNAVTLITMNNRLLPKNNGAVDLGTVVSDSDYNHTDNNYTTTEKNKLAGLSNYDDTTLAGRVTANETALTNVYTKTEIDGKLTNILSTSVGLFDGFDDYVTMSATWDDVGGYNALLITDGFSDTSTTIPMGADVITGVGYFTTVITGNTSSQIILGKWNIIKPIRNSTKITPPYNYDFTTNVPLTFIEFNTNNCGRLTSLTWDAAFVFPDGITAPTATDVSTTSSKIIVILLGVNVMNILKYS